MDAAGSLPRSLHPLPDESLIGFMLRISHRLDERPTQLAIRAGITPHLTRDEPVPQSPLLRLPPASAEDLARLTKLDPDTVHALTLEPYHRRYPPVADELRRTSRDPQARGAKTTWLTLASTRCLAGDTSQVQQRHGGAWKRQWHLPVVFACLEHHCFL
jgi:hypothetical protein